MPSIFYQRDFQAQSIYHLYNRGTLGSEIFRDESDYRTFIFILSYYLRMPHGKPLSYLQIVTHPYARTKAKSLTPSEKKPVTLHSYCLTSDHFHLILEENLGSPKPGISNLMKHLSVTYAMYYNKKYGKVGSLFQGKYKTILVPDDERLLQLSKYLHKDHGTHDSYSDFFDNQRTWVYPDRILLATRTHDTLSYRTFVEETPPNIAFLGRLTLD